VRGLDTLIAAPTGSGKALAGFLVAINSLYRAHAAGEDVSGATRVVYVSPLKALAVDIAQNLERPLLEIGSVAAELGLSPAPVSVAVRTGDTSASERARMLRRCPSLIVTTPNCRWNMALLEQRRQASAVRARDPLTLDRHLTERLRWPLAAAMCTKFIAVAGRRPKRDQ
jgi:ATP-dependent Lhr-like helicase